MKRCPECSRTYSDDTIAFCLADGALLSAPYDANETLRFAQPPPTQPAAIEAWPDNLRRVAEPPQPTRWKPVYFALIALPLVLAGLIAFWLVLKQRSDSTNKSEIAAPAASAMPNSQPSALPSPSSTADKSAQSRAEASPIPSATPDLSYLTGTYSLYRLEDPSGGQIGTMTLRVRKGNEIFVRGADWAGSGKIDGKQGYYDWKFEDGKYGRTTVLVNDDGTLQGRVFGSKIDWWYLARREK